MTNEETAIAAAKTAAEIWLRRRPWIAPQDHDDLKQEAAIAALSAVKTYRADKGASLKTWCGAKAAWKLSELAVTRARRNAKYGRPMSLEECPAVSRRDPGQSLVDAASDAATVLDVLSPRQVALLRLISEGRSVEDAARSEGIELGGAAKSIMVARRVAAGRFPELACRYGVA